MPASTCRSSTTASSRASRSAASGTGSIGRTYRGDVARWHLEVGSHRHEPVAADGFSLFVGGPDGSRATVLSALRPAELPDVGLDPARRRRDVPRAVPAGVAGVRARDVLGVRLIGEQLSPVIARRPRAERPARRGVRVVGGEPWARPVDGRAPVHLGRSVRGRRVRPRRDPTAWWREDGALAVEFGDAADDAPAALRGTLVDRGTGWRRRGAERALDVRSGRRPGALVRLRRRRAAGARGRAIGGRSASGSGVGRGGRGDVRARARRAPLRPVRDRLGPAGRRVRRRPPLVEALHEGVGPDRRRAPSTSRGTRSPRRPAWRTGHRGLAGAVPRRPGAPRLVRDGAVQRAVLPRRRRLVLGARRGRRPGAGSRRHRPVRAPRVRGLPVLRHRRRRLLRLVRAARGVPRARAPRDPRPARGDPGRRCPRSSRSRRPAPARRARSAAPSRTTSAARRTTRSSAPTGTRSRTSTTGRTSGPKFVLQAWRDAIAAGPEAGRRADRATSGRRSTPS